MTKTNPKLKYYQIQNKSKIQNPKQREHIFWILDLEFVW
jgi:hypothetical protein